MSEYQKGDRVEVLSGWQSRRGEVLQVLEVDGSGMIYRYKIGSGDTNCAYMWLYAESLRLVPAFKPGDRVQVKEYKAGYDVTIVCVYRSDGGHGPHDLYELSDGTYRKADELQIAPEPKREPKAGEVWAAPSSKRVYLRTDDQGREAPWVSLDGGIRFAYITNSPVFVAPDLASYFKARQ